MNQKQVKYKEYRMRREGVREMKGEEVKKDGKGKMCGQSQKQNRIWRFPSEQWFIMTKFHREFSESKLEVTERKVRASSLHSCLHLDTLLCACSPSLSLSWSPSF